MSKQVFVSYSTQDTASAEQVRDGLETAGLTCWMAPRDIAPGLDYGTQIIDAIEACTVLVLVLSENSNYSIYVRKEVERAIAKGKVIIPLRIQQVAVSRSLEFFISDAQWIDAWDGAWARITTTLHSAVRGHLADQASRGESPAAPAPRPTHAADLLPSPTHSPSATHQPPPVERALFVGRQSQMAELEAALDQSLAGHGQLRFVTGEAGAGKSALLNEFQFRASEQDAHLLIASGACDAQTGTADPYLPFREILTALARQDAGRSALLEYGPNLIDTLVPGIALGSHRSGADRTPEAKPVEQSLIFEQTVKVLQTVALRSPLVLILEDLHWVDEASNGLLFRLARQLEGSRILLLGTYRSEEVSLGRGSEPHPLQKMVGELQRQLGEVHIDLDAAREKEGMALVSALLDSEPNRLDAAFRQALHTHTGGHPLFVVELLRDLQSDGGLVRDTDGQWIVGPDLNWAALPARVEGIIGVRMDRLDAEERQLLTTASVLGEHFIAEAVALALKIDGRQVAQQLSGPLQKQHRLVQIEHMERLGRQRITHFRFSHNLMQVYLYEELDESERSFLHEDVGYVLEELYGEQAHTIAVQLARHFQAAELPDKALPYLIQAGEKAFGLSAYPEASGYFAQALALLDELPESEEKKRQEFTIQYSLGRINEAIQGIGSHDAGVAYTRALDLGRQLGDAMSTLQVLLALTQHASFRSELSSAQAYGEEGRRLATELQDPELITLANQSLMLIALGLGQHDKVVVYTDQNIEFYRGRHGALTSAALTSDDVLNLMWTLSAGALSLAPVGFPDRALDQVREGLAIGEANNHLYSKTSSLGMVASIHLRRGEWEAALSFGEQQQSQSEKADIFLNRTYGGLHAGVSMAMLGDVDEGARLVRQAFQDRASIGVYSFQVAYYALLAQAFGRAGRVTEGIGLIHEGFDAMVATNDRQDESQLNRVKGELLLAQTLPADEMAAAQQEAEECFRQAIQTARKGGARVWEARAMAHLCRLLEQQGRAEEWQQQMGELRELYACFTEGFTIEDLRVVKEVLDSAHR